MPDPPESVEPPKVLAKFTKSVPPVPVGDGALAEVPVAEAVAEAVTAVQSRVPVGGVPLGPE